MRSTSCIGYLRECDFPARSLVAPKPRYRSKQGLTWHVEASHEGRKFPCMESGCTKAYTRQEKLTRHVKARHEGRDFPCTELSCSKSSTPLRISISQAPSASLGTKNGRKRVVAYRRIQDAHKRKPYRCPYCSKAYKGKSGQRNHMVSMHEKWRLACTEP